LLSHRCLSIASPAGKDTFETCKLFNGNAARKERARLHQVMLVGRCIVEREQSQSSAGALELCTDSTTGLPNARFHDLRPVMHPRFVIINLHSQSRRSQISQQRHDFVSILTPIRILSLSLALSFSLSLSACLSISLPLYPSVYRYNDELLQAGSAKMCVREIESRK